MGSRRQTSPTQSTMDMAVEAGTERGTADFTMAVIRTLVPRRCGHRKYSSLLQIWPMRGHKNYLHQVLLILHCCKTACILVTISY